MLKSGIVSITFRKLSVAEIINAAKQANITAIEWGGDVHVPHGNLDAARTASNMTLDAGLEVAAYGSYFRAGEPQNPPIADIVKSAVSLKAPVIRIWAGKRGTCDADADYQKQVICDSQKIADLACIEGIDIAFEFHVNTLADSTDAAKKLIELVARKNVKSYWQPIAGLSGQQNLNFLKTMLPWLANVHVFNWINFENRFLLEQARDIWTEYLILANTVDSAKYAMIEYVLNDSLENFYKDAQTLNSILCNLNHYY
jgi:3-dehydroshikimate dehydratase